MKGKLKSIFFAGYYKGKQEASNDATREGYVLASPHKHKRLDECFDFSITDMATLKCTHCDDICLHQVGMVWFQRPEDSEEVGVFWVAGEASGHFTRINEGSGNPSSRRDGSAMVFECENCPGHTVLYVAQHKGLSLFRIGLPPEWWFAKVFMGHPQNA